MMHPYSPSPRWLAVPGIGFPQNISVGPNALDPQNFRDWSFAEGRKTDAARQRLEVKQTSGEIVGRVHSTD
jgi:hypothetical protein